MSEPQVVLIVDDDPEILKTILVACRRELRGITIVTASSPATGLRILDKFTPNVIVTDLRMPEMDGIRFADAVSARAGELPFIFITGFPTEELYQRAALKRHMLILAKPFHLRELAWAISAALAPSAPAMSDVATA